MLKRIRSLSFVLYRLEVSFRIQKLYWYFNPLLIWSLMHTHLEPHRDLSSLSSNFNLALNSILLKSAGGEREEGRTTRKKEGMKSLQWPLTAQQEAPSPSNSSSFSSHTLPLNSKALPADWLLYTPRISPPLDPHKCPLFPHPHNFPLKSHHPLSSQACSGKGWHHPVTSMSLFFQSSHIDQELFGAPGLANATWDAAQVETESKDLGLKDKQLSEWRTRSLSCKSRRG